MPLKRPIDFHAFTVVNLYKDDNAYELRGAYEIIERPAFRNYLGEIFATQRGNNRYELALGDHGRSGEQYDIWQAVYGPVGKSRWIYACAKQLLDRVIYAQGSRGALPFTLFRPFNWFGPRQDDVWKRGKANRVVTQFLSNILHGDPITLVDGGAQKRCFLYIDDAIQALARIIENKDGRASRQIFNIGNPKNDVSVAELAKLIITAFKDYPEYREHAAQAKVVVVPSGKYFGKYYQDIQKRVPSIANAKKQLGWQPKVRFKELVKIMVEHDLDLAKQELQISKLPKP